MPLAEIDAALARFEAAVAVMGNNLVDLESSPGSKLLDPAGLSGVTKERVLAARQTLSALWEHFSEFRAVVDKARELRGRGGHVHPTRIEELEALLNGPSVTLSPLDVPLANRGLYTPAETPVATTPDRLLADMGAAFDTAKRELLAVDEAWRTLVPRLGAAQEAVVELSAVATELGQPDTNLERARTRLAALGPTVARDPLAVPGTDLDQVEASLASVRGRLDALARDRQTLDQDLEGCALTLDEISGALAAGETALAATRVKIQDPPGLLAPLDRGCLTDPERGLLPWLDRLRSLAKAGDWQRACRGVDQWQRLAAETLTAARRVAEANAAPLEHRNELRGRLDALAAKADRLGLTEDPALSALREQARTVLFTAPTDVEAAAKLVSRYGASLTAADKPASRS